MNLRHTAPFLRLLLPFSTGIYAGLQLSAYLPESLNRWATVLLFFISLCCGLYLLWQATRKKRLSAHLVLVAIIGTGLLLPMAGNPFMRSSHYARFAAAPEMLVRICDAPQPRSSGWKAEAEVVSLLYNDRRISCSGKILLYMQTDSSRPEKSGHYGDLLRVRGRLQEIPGASFPEAFDFAALVETRGIRHRLFVKPGHLFYLGNEGNPVRAMAYRIAAKTNALLKEHFPERTAAILASLLLGIRSELESRDLLAFKNTGTLHVLAVSGMHIAIIYGALMWLIGLLPQWIPHRAALILVALLIWAYACISGLSASVCRAALMCTITLLGQILKRESSLSNNLCATAFILLIWEPHWIADAGFLLSFSAVAGIFLFQPLLERCWQPEFLILRKIRDLLTVSLSAQLGTLPVSLYFFHQFASWFLMGNLIIIPLSTLALFGGLAFLAAGKVLYLGSLIKLITGHCTLRMLDCADTIGKFPYALLDSCYLNWPEASCLTSGIIGAAHWLQNPEQRRPWLMLCGFLWLFALNAARSVEEQFKQEALIYAQQGKTWCVLMRKGNSANILSNDTGTAHTWTKEYRNRYRLKPNFVSWSNPAPWISLCLRESEMNDAAEGVQVLAKGTRKYDSSGIFLNNGRKHLNALPESRALLFLQTEPGKTYKIYHTSQLKLF